MRGASYHGTTENGPRVRPRVWSQPSGSAAWALAQINSNHLGWQCRVGIHDLVQQGQPELVPDGSQMLCLARENSRRYNSLWMTSTDEGATWSEMAELPWALTGDRHIARYGPDGRILVTFRDMARDSETYGDILVGSPGQYRLRLLKNHGRPGDTGSASLELLANGTFVSTTYCVLEPGRQPVVVSIRFKLSDIDDVAGSGSSGLRR